ncbi:diguanylate cyclase domain-containing protein [Streptomyces sp. NPDC001388]|uniref:diguanylate cyclase domain-containing protein n=1 Tax=Streptomyces sp. NPDC001388 TaxID=3364568 RepID=UPI00369867AB
MSSAVSMGAGGVHHLVVEGFAFRGPLSAVLLDALVWVLAAVVIAAGIMATLVMAAADNDTVPIRLRRLCDGWLIAGSLLTVGRVVMLYRDVQGADVSMSFLTLARAVADMLVLGLLIALRYCLHRTERRAVTVAVLGLAGVTAGDMLRALRLHADVGCLTTVCWTSGLLLVAVSPWLPGSVGAVGFDRKMIPVIGVVAPFVPLVVCLLAVAVPPLFGVGGDLAMWGLVGSMLAALCVRQGTIHADHLRLTRECTERGEHYRTLIDHSCDVITIASLDGRVRYVSPAVHPALGYRPEDLVGVRLQRLCHPEDAEALVRAVRVLRSKGEVNSRGTGHRVVTRVRDAAGRWCHVEAVIGHHPEGLIVVSRDASDRVAERARLEHLAFHDALTGLPNRILFSDRLAQALRDGTENTAPPVVLFVDLDGFKSVNDSAGHAAGDDILVQASGRLRTSVPADGLVARLGGDEFAALLQGRSSPDPAGAEEVARRILDALAEPYRLGSTTALISASIGLAVAEPGITPRELLHRADLAMYEAKAAGKGRVRVHERRQLPVGSRTSTPR